MGHLRSRQQRQRSHPHPQAGIMEQPCKAHQYRRNQVKQSADCGDGGGDYEGVRKMRWA